MNWGGSKSRLFMRPGGAAGRLWLDPGIRAVVSLSSFYGLDLCPSAGARCPLEWGWGGESGLCKGAGLQEFL